MSQKMQNLTDSINAVRDRLNNAKAKGQTKDVATLAKKLASLTADRNLLEVERYERWNVTEVIR